MRILSVHNRYQEPGGEDAVFEAEAALLAKHGHQVRLLEFDNRQIDANDSVISRAQLALGTVWSRTGSHRVMEAARESGADIVHFHNTFPLVSPAAYSACQRLGVPVVQTLHNYRLLCPAALFFRNGRSCEDCLGRRLPHPSVVHRCYRDSRAQTSVAAAMLVTHRVRGTWRNDVDRFIALTEFARSKFLEGGLPSAKVMVKPNFINPSSFEEPLKSRSGFLFVGRLTPDKGIHTLLDAWLRSTGLPMLSVVGDGPSMPAVRDAARQHAAVTALGRKSKQDVLAHMRTASALIFPSVWYEGFPMTIAEAFASGTPVIASRLGAMEEIIDDGQTGLLFEPGSAEDLAAKVRWACEHPGEMRRMGEAARREFEAKYTPERNYTLLMEIYHEAIDSARQRRRARGPLSTQGW